MILLIQCCYYSLALIYADHNDQIDNAGGDGSLTGANLFKEEWISLVAELMQNRQISVENALKYNHLNIVGLVSNW